MAVRGDNSPVRVLFIINGLSTGGAEMMLYALLKNLSQNFNPHVISLTSEGDLGPKIRALHVDLETLELNPSAPNPLKLLKLVRRIRQIRPDVVHTWMHHANLLGGLGSRLAGVKKIAWGIHSGGRSAEDASWTTRAIIRANAILSGFVPFSIQSCSNRAIREYVELGYRKDKLVVIPNGFDLSRYHPDAAARLSVRRELGLGNDVPLIGLIARFHPVKNHRHFLRAAGRMHQAKPDVHFMMAGDNVDRHNPELSRWIGEEGLRSVTHCLGPRDDIPRLIAALDIATMTSRSEAFPLVLGEAMACAIPCVATDVGDSAYLVGETGTIVPLDDVDELARAWQTLLGLPLAKRQEFGQKARRRISENFDIRAVTGRFEAYYRELMQS